MMCTKINPHPEGSPSAKTLVYEVGAFFFVCFALGVTRFMLPILNQIIKHSLQTTWWSCSVSQTDLLMWFLMLDMRVSRKMAERTSNGRRCTLKSNVHRLVYTNTNIPNASKNKVELKHSCFDQFPDRKQHESDT